MTEKTLFLGPRIPKEVKLLIPCLEGLDKQTFRLVVQLIVSSIEGKDIPDNALTLIRQQTSCQKDLETIFAGLHCLIHAALRIPQTSLKSECFKEDLKDLKIPPDFVNDLSNAVYGARRASMDEANLRLQPSHPTMAQLKWRVDVAISTSVLNRVLQPSILLEMTLSDGKIHNFEVPVSKFHLLRYNVATVLKELQELEHRHVFKIQD